MTLLAGHRLEHSNQYFKGGNPTQCGSSYDLNVGQIIDVKGKNVEDQVILKPGELVQVVTDECFRLPKTVTGHVTCKTTLTRRGVWALTVGIIDPGWDAPITTTLLNFSKVDFIVHVGQPFLRVSFFEHDEIDEKFTRHRPNEVDGYYKEVRRFAATYFPKTFLNSEQISEAAGQTAARKLRNNLLFWVPVFAVLFAVLQVFVAWVPPRLPGWSGATLEQLHSVQLELTLTQQRVEELENQIKAKSSP